MLLIILRIYASSLLIWKNIPLNYNQGRILDFKLGGAHLKTFALSGGRRENFWGLSCEKNHIFSNFGGGGQGARARCAPWIHPWQYTVTVATRSNFNSFVLVYFYYKIVLFSKCVLLSMYCRNMNKIFI